MCGCGTHSSFVAERYRQFRGLLEWLEAIIPPLAKEREPSAIEPIALVFHLLSDLWLSGGIPGRERSEDRLSSPPLLERRPRAAITEALGRGVTAHGFVGNHLLRGESHHETTDV